MKPFLWLKLCDFGCARANSGTLVTRNTGSAPTLHPDVVKGNYSSITELYSIGAIMYFVLNRHYPFPEESEYDRYELIKKGNIPFIDLPEEYQPFVVLTRQLLDLGKLSLDPKKDKKVIESKWALLVNNQTAQ